MNPRVLLAIWNRLLFYEPKTNPLCETLLAAKVVLQCIIDWLNWTNLNFQLSKDAVFLNSIALNLNVNQKFLKPRKVILILLAISVSMWYIDCANQIKDLTFPYKRSVTKACSSCTRSARNMMISDYKSMQSSMHNENPFVMIMKSNTHQACNWYKFQNPITAQNWERNRVEIEEINGLLINVIAFIKRRNMWRGCSGLTSYNAESCHFVNIEFTRRV